MVKARGEERLSELNVPACTFYLTIISNMRKTYR